MEEETMATKKNITDQRDIDVALLQQKIDEAGNIENGLMPGKQRERLGETIKHLTYCQSDLLIQQLKDGLNNSQLAVALTKIVTASEDLKKEADKMKTVTTFISRTNAVIGAATKVTNLIKNGG